MRPTFILLFLCLLALLTGCINEPVKSYLPDVPRMPRVPLVYHIDVQQGNVVTQEMIAQLEKGMDKKRVQLIMGTPLIIDVFHPNRWDYYYSMSENGAVPESRRISLIFEGENLARIVGDTKTASGPLVVEKHHDTTVSVPKSEARTLVGKISNIDLGFGKDKKKKKKEDVIDESVIGEEKKDLRDLTGGEEKDEGLTREKSKGREEEAIGEGEGEKKGRAESEEGEEKGQAADKGKGDAEKSEEEILAEKEAIRVPKEKRVEEKGIFKRLMEKIGIGENEKASDYDPGKVKYKDPSAAE